MFTTGASIDVSYQNEGPLPPGFASVHSVREGVRGGGEKSNEEIERG